MTKKTGWGAARLGKVVTDSAKHGYSEPKVKSSRNLRGLYSEYQGKTLNEGKKSK